MSRSHLATEPLPLLQARREANQADDISALLIHLRGMTLLVVTCYLRPSIGGVVGPNVERLQNLAAILMLLNICWVVFADWNCEPRSLTGSG